MNKPRQASPVQGSPVQGSPNHELILEVNGMSYPVSIDPGRNLLSVIRQEVGLTGTKQGCDDCECGACMVLIDGQGVNSCSYLAAQTEGRAVTTIEGLSGNSETGAGASGDRELHAIQRNLLDAGGVQCGFCTPGMIMSTHALLADNPTPSDEEIRIGLSGNLCRCTGYTKILDAVRATAVELAKQQETKGNYGWRSRR